jgi:hypothetical protein
VVAWESNKWMVSRQGGTIRGVSDAKRVEEMRAEFFRRTRILVVVLYGMLAAAAVGAGVYAVSIDLARAAVAITVGLVIVLALFRPLFPISARLARVLVVVGAVGGMVVAGVLSDLGSQIGSPGLWGGFAGFAFGMILGIAWIRRRLARDDSLLLRQKRLGFDPERPYAWILGARRSRSG